MKIDLKSIQQTFKGKKNRGIIESDSLAYIEDRRFLYSGLQIPMTYNYYNTVGGENNYYVKKIPEDLVWVDNIGQNNCSLYALTITGIEEFQVDAETLRDRLIKLIKEKRKERLSKEWKKNNKIAAKNDKDNGIPGYLTEEREEELRKEAWLDEQDIKLLCSNYNVSMVLYDEQQKSWSESDTKKGNPLIYIHQHSNIKAFKDNYKLWPARVKQDGSERVAGIDNILNGKTLPVTQGDNKPQELDWLSVNNDGNYAWYSWRDKNHPINIGKKIGPLDDKFSNANIRGGQHFSTYIRKADIHDFPDTLETLKKTLKEDVVDLVEIEGDKMGHQTFQERCERDENHLYKLCDVELDGTLPLKGFFVRRTIDGIHYTREEQKVYLEYERNENISAEPPLKDVGVDEDRHVDGIEHLKKHITSSQKGKDGEYKAGPRKFWTVQERDAYEKYFVDYVHLRKTLMDKKLISKPKRKELTKEKADDQKKRKAANRKAKAASEREQRKTEKEKARTRKTIAKSKAASQKKRLNRPRTNTKKKKSSKKPKFYPRERLR